MNSRVALCALFAGIAVAMSGCGSTRIRRLSGPEFVQQVERGKVISSFSWTTYIGSTGNRAYLEHGEAPFAWRGSRTTVYWTPLAELPSDVVDSLEKGEM